MKADGSPDPIDWSLTTWDGSRREQLRHWAELPLERIMLAIEEMQALAQALAAPAADPHKPDPLRDFRMRMIPLDSTAISRVGYDAEKQVLRLEYRNSRIYDYAGVPPHIYKQLLGADSAGEFVNLEIKPRYECSEVD